MTAATGTATDSGVAADKAIATAAAITDTVGSGRNNAAATSADHAP